MKNNKIKSPDGIYEIHIPTNEEISYFKDENDFEKYFSILKSVKERYGFKLISYYIIKREIRLIIKEKSDSDRGCIIKELSRRYSIYYKRKYNYERIFFKKGYKSFPIKKENLIKDVVLMHNLAYKVDEIKYSSFEEYFNNYVCCADTDIILKDIKKEEFLAYHYIITDDKKDELSLAKEYIKNFLGVKRFSDITYINKEDLYVIVKALHNEKKLSVSSIAKAIGRTRQNVYYIIKKK